MRRGFEGAMRDYGEMAKDEKEAKRLRREARDQKGFAAAQKEVDRLEGVVSWHTEKRARNTGARDVEAQSQVYSLQKKKQEVMDRLKKELAALDAPDAPEASVEKKEAGERDARPVIAKGDELFWRRDDGTETPVTLGEIVTDGVWGVEYDADASVPRVMRKRLLAERAKREIQDMLDEQIITEEVASGRVHPSLKEAYLAIRELRELGELPHGVIAEKMIDQLVRKKILDEDAPYRYEPGDVFQDVVRKIDFVIRRSDYGRGVRTEDTGDDLGAKAVQLTINKDPDALQRKRSQIERTRDRLDEGDRIDDIALVQFDQRAVADAYRKWVQGGRPPGGPDKFIAQAVRDRMFKELVAGMGE